MEGEEHLKRALAKGKGVIALSAHLGAFTMIGARLAAAGYPFSSRRKTPRVTKGWRGLSTTTERNSASARFPPSRARKRCGEFCKRCANNGIVLVIADEFKSGGVEISFMGQKAAAPRGPASLALRTGAATLPMFAARAP